MQEAYANFFKAFELDDSKIIKHGLIDTKYPEVDKIDSFWNELKDNIKNNKEVFIRGYGRNAHGTELFEELYRTLQLNDNIKKDSTNNSKPTQLLQKITNYSKSVKADFGRTGKEKISNYQVSHIFGKTKNPYLFTAPWNIVWKPKFMDPFTGHESSGSISKEYKKQFFKKCYNMYEKYINEYNELAAEKFSKENLEQAFKKIEKKNIQKKLRNQFDSETFNRFKKDAEEELSIITRQ